MKDLSFYDQVGILFPGSVLLIGLLVLFPEFKAEFSTGGVSVGDLGLFLIVAYVLGHLVAAGGELLEKITWALDGGMPGSWLAREKPPFLKLSARFAKKSEAKKSEAKESEAKEGEAKEGEAKEGEADKSEGWTFLEPGGNGRVQAKLKKRLDIEVVIANIDQKTMQRYFWPIYQDALTHETGTNRITTFNGIYGLSRGIAVVMLFFAAGLPLLGLLYPPGHIPHWPFWSLGLVVVATIFIYRMRGFGEHFAREVYRVFTQLPDDPVPSSNSPKKAAAE
jgi:hypothetical protein